MKLYDDNIFVFCIFLIQNEGAEGADGSLVTPSGSVADVEDKVSPVKSETGDTAEAPNPVVKQKEKVSLTPTCSKSPVML